MSHIKDLRFDFVGTEESLLGFKQQDVTELCFGMSLCWRVDLKKWECMQVDLKTVLMSSQAKFYSHTGN